MTELYCVIILRICIAFLRDAQIPIPVSGIGTDTRVEYYYVVRPIPVVYVYIYSGGKMQRNVSGKRIKVIL